MRGVLVGVALTTLIAGPALASEMTMPGPAPTYYSKSVPWFYDWSGLYFGGLAGYARASTNNNITNTATGLFDSATSLTTNNVQLGGRLGFDYVSPWHVLVGIEADAVSGNDHTTVISNPGGTNVYTQEMKIAASGTVGARFGFVLNNFLVYGTGGWAWAADTVTRTQVTGTTGKANPGTIESLSPSLTGWTAGGGVSLGFWRNWEVFAEYRYVSYSTATIVYPIAQRSVTSTTTVNSILGGVNFKFNPFVGRY